MFAAHDRKHRIEPAKILIISPVFPKFNSSTRKIATIFLKLFIKPFIKRKRIARRTGETRNDLTLIKKAKFFGIAFHDRLTQSNLAIGAESGFAILDYPDYCCRSNKMLVI